MSGRAAVRAYGALVRLLPAAVRDADGEEMVRTFEALWRDAATGGRAGLLARSLARLLQVIAVEWLERMPSGAAGARRALSAERLWALRSSLRVAARSLWRTPAFTWSVVLLLGLGIGGVTAIFTVVDGVLLRPLPYPAADRLVAFEYSQSGSTLRDVRAFRSLRGAAAVRTLDANLTGSGRPERLVAAEVSPGFLPLFGARAAAGRLLLASGAAEDGVVLSHAVWSRDFGGDPSVVGRTLTLNGEAVTVVGVMAPSFEPPEALVGRTVDVWTRLDDRAPWFRRRDNEQLRLAARLAPGATVAAAQAEASALARARARAYPDQYDEPDCPAFACPGGYRPLLVQGLDEATVGSARRGLGLLLGAVTLLLLVACANVAQLFLARALARGREMAVRRALGARTAALVELLVAENLILAVAGAALGVLLAAGLLRGLDLVHADGLPRGGAPGLGPTALAFSVAVAVLACLLFGLLPTLGLLRRGSAALGGRERGGTADRRTGRIGAGLIVVEVALSLVLLSSAGLMLRSLLRLHEQPLGFRTDHVWTIPLSPVPRADGPDLLRRAERIRESLAATPGVAAATWGTTLPLQYTGGITCCWNNRPVLRGVESPTLVQMLPVDAGFFDLLGLRFLAGSAWERDRVDPDAPLPVVVSAAVALEASGSGSARDAVGRPMRLGGMDFRIVGVVEESHYYGADQPPRASAYLPIAALRGHVDVPTHFAVLVPHPDPDLQRRLREAVWRVEPDLPVPDVRSLQAWNGAANASRRFESLLFGAFGVVALLLVAGGLCGALLYTVGRRRRELGVRLALGDSPGRLQGRIIAQGLRLTALGCAVGLGGALLAGRLLQNRLFGVDARDLGALLPSLAILAATALLASWLPARRAAVTDPMEALRAE